jgi:hypothetical protein
MKRLFNIKYFFIAMLLTQGCAKSVERDNPLDGKTLPFVTTLPATNTTSTSALTGGVISKDGGLAISAKGILYSKAPNAPVQSASKYEVGPGFLNYSSVLNGLTPATVYYYKSYATNLLGTAYGLEMSFKTSNDKPTIYTNSPSSVTSSNITIGGNILSDNGAPITQKGVVVSTTNFVDTNAVNVFARSIVKYDSTTNNTFIVNVPNLKEATPYFIMAFARNSLGIRFGNIVPVTTAAKIPTIETTPVYDETSYTAKSGGQISSDGGSPILSKGIVWSVNPNPTITNSTTLTSVGSGNASFVSDMINLVPGTTYYVKAYARNAIGVAYGTERQFKASPLKPVIAAASFIAQYASSVEVRSTIVYDGGSPVLDFGFVYHTASNPTIATGKKVQYGNNTNGKTRDINFSSSIDGLQAGVTYYITSYVTTAITTVYGTPELVYTTSASTPKVSTLSFSNVGFNNAKITGLILNNAGSAVFEKGVVIGQSPNPTYNSFANSTFTDLNTSDLTNISVTATGLKAGTLYYARAYAKNSVGVGYGDPQVSFTTNDSKPVLSDVTLNSVTSSSVVVNGNISNTYSLPITEKGFIWSKFNTLTIGSSNNTGRQNLGTGSASFSHPISNLEPGTVYYVKSYATNESGTGYSKLGTFTTESTTPSVTTNPLSIVVSSSATIKAVINNDGGSPILSAGFIVSTVRNQAANSTNQITIQNPSVGDISTTRVGLTSRTTYYYRAFATNAKGRVEGLEYSFYVP